MARAALTCMPQPGHRPKPRSQQLRHAWTPQYGQPRSSPEDRSVEAAAVPHRSQNPLVMPHLSYRPRMIGGACRASSVPCGMGLRLPAISSRFWRVASARLSNADGTGVSAPGRIRTCDLPLRRRLLCPLSYGDAGGGRPTRATTLRDSFAVHLEPVGPSSGQTAMGSPSETTHTRPDSPRIA